MYAWLSEAISRQFSTLSVLKESPRGTVSLLQHAATGRRFILRRFTGSGAVYRKLMNIRCPNLPQIYEVATRGEDNLVLEEYVRGDNMGDLLQGSLFTGKETRRIALQLCRALWALHSMDAVHRDVKPENVILRETEAVLIDFDAARLFKQESARDTQILGTTGFAAPEQYGMSQTDHRADIYSMGVLLNVMLTGQHPSRCLAKGRWGRIVTRCTQVNPEKRYQTILQLSEELF